MRGAKFTVRISRDLLENARVYAKQNNTTQTNLIEAYFHRIPARHPCENAPLVGRLSGILPKDVSTEDYQKHLDEKFG